AVPRRTSLTRYLLCFYYSPAPRDLPSFPTRRSSDLADAELGAGQVVVDRGGQADHGDVETREVGTFLQQGEDRFIGVPAADNQRSEEHTSELQSRENLVCRLLLEKKKEKMWLAMDRR